MIKKPTAANMTRAAEIIRNAGIIAFPTETVYGLGANALDAAAIKKIFKAKGRPLFDPLIVHADGIPMLEKIGVHLDEKALRLAQKFWPGPLTLIVKKPDCIPDIVTSGLRTMAVRVPAHPVALRLIKEAGVPIAAPSANPFGYLSPVTAFHVEEQLGKKVPFILDGGSCSVGIESTILDITSKIPTILRPGGITIEAIRKIEGQIHIKKSIGMPSAPGQLKSHYAPIKPLKLLSRQKIIDKIHNAKRKREAAAFLLIKPMGKQNDRQIPILSLSRNGNMAEAAQNLFHHLHTLDNTKATIVYVEKPKNIGLGHAVLDRLTRAEKKKREMKTCE